MSTHLSSGHEQYRRFFHYPDDMRPALLVIP